MTDYPLLPTPESQDDVRPPGSGRGGNIVTPSRARQRERIGPEFRRLQEVFDGRRDMVSLHDDPSGIAPERAIVFEVAGSIKDFGAAVMQVKGLEFLADETIMIEPDGEFGVKESRKGKGEGIRKDKLIDGRLYMAMPDSTSLQQLLSLWRMFESRQDAPRGLGPWFYIFKHLRDLRGWGPMDRIPEETIIHLQEELGEVAKGEKIRIEVDLWFAGSPTRRTAAKDNFVRMVERCEGEIVDQAEIADIGYLGYLVDLPRHEILRLIGREEVNIVVCDDVMIVRPQSSIEFPIESEPLTVGEALPEPEVPTEESPPIVAVLDAMPVQAHVLLDGRLKLDDPDDYGTLSLVSQRRHGTEMASLVLYGDRNLEGEPLSRKVYFRPIMYAPGNGVKERPNRDYLFLNVIYRAILRMKVGDDEDGPQAQEVFIVNLSIGISNRPYAGQMSPLGRLLDYLAYEYGILFLVSAGNINTSLPVPEFSGLIEFEVSETPERETAILKALSDQQPFRTLFSPAEAMNVITVGAWYEDSVSGPTGSAVYAPYADEPGPNISSALGLGHRNTVKPDILMPGGRERLRVVGGGEAVQLRNAPSGRLYGLWCAVPALDGGTEALGLSAGTSAATALATRAAHRIFDALSDQNDGNLLDEIDPRYYAVIVKAMLVHRAKWGPLAEKLEKTWQPQGHGKHIARRDRIARLFGYGHPEIEEAMACASNRATMIGCGEIREGELQKADLYQIPLPPSLEGVEEPRALTVSLAWFSPINTRHQAYRRAKLEIAPENLLRRFGVNRIPGQPADKSVLRGSLLHTRYDGQEAVDFVDGRFLALRVYCREQGGALDQSIPYGLAVTIEAGQGIPVYDDIRQALGIRPRS